MWRHKRGSQWKWHRNVSQMHHLLLNDHWNSEIKKNFWEFIKPHKNKTNTKSHLNESLSTHFFQHLLQCFNIFHKLNLSSGGQGKFCFSVMLSKILHEREQIFTWFDQGLVNLALIFAFELANPEALCILDKCNKVPQWCNGNVKKPVATLSLHSHLFSCS